MPIVVILTRFNAPALSLGDHHHGLLLCWKLRTGLQKNVDPARMMAYCQRFHAEHLVPHFGLEEEAIFPILGNDHELVKRALVL
ncbi:MAG: hypothetical protein IPP83_10860 [Flavobacteriales bacterium]|nr:hypothetical protein [Flavobacteriales bacterium]